jgi:hypothetical protein
MAKAQTDIRSTSYSEPDARPFGYQGTIEDVLAQIRAEPDVPYTGPSDAELLWVYLGIDKVPSGNGPSVEDDQDVWYGAPG